MKFTQETVVDGNEVVVMYFLNDFPVDEETYFQVVDVMSGFVEENPYSRSDIEIYVREQLIGKQNGIDAIINLVIDVLEKGEEIFE